MIKNITLGQYFPGNSPIHRLDPRTKLLLTITLIVIIFIVRTVFGYAAVLALILFGAALSGLHMKLLVRGIKPIWFILVLMFVLNVFFIKGEKLLFSWQFIKIYEEGVIKALIMAARLILLIFATTLMTLTTSPMEITDGLERLLSPLKVIKFPVHELALMMSIALRFIPTLVEETDRIMKAQTARGASFQTGGLISRAKGLVPILVPLFVSAFKRADELALAMEARCYNGGKNRTRMKVLKMGHGDLIAAVVVLALLAGAIIYL